MAWIERLWRRDDDALRERERQRSNTKSPSSDLVVPRIISLLRCLLREIESATLLEWTRRDDLTSRCRSRVHLGSASHRSSQFGSDS